MEKTFDELKIDIQARWNSAENLWIDMGLEQVADLIARDCSKIAEGVLNDKDNLVSLAIRGKYELKK